MITFFHIHFIICHFSRLWAVDCCCVDSFGFFFVFFNANTHFFSDAPGPFPFVSCTVRKTDALNNYDQRLFLKSCQLLLSST